HCWTIITAILGPKICPANVKKMKTSCKESIATILATETPIAYNHLQKESLKVLRKLSQKSLAILISLANTKRY
ncbi:MAG: hypothetical protein ACK56F_18225, partial [bacterium]